MTQPLVVDIPHSLGREEARRRISSRLGSLPAQLPGGVADVRTSWPTPDRLDLQATALGQQLSATVDIADAHVRVTAQLPPMLGMMSGAIEAAVRAKGGDLLLGPPTKA